MKYCNNCGKSMDEQATFCNSCGAEFGTVIQEQNQNDQCEQYTSESLLFTFNDITVDLQEIINRNGKNKMNAIKELRELTKIDLATGKKVIDEAYLGRIYYPTEKEIKAKNNKGCLTVFLWVFFLPIMGIITIVKNEKLTKRVKVILISIIVFISLIAGIDGIIDNQQQEKKAYDNIKISVENKEYIKAQEEINSFLNEYSSSKYVEEVKKIQTTVNAEAKAKAEAEAKTKPVELSETQYKAQCVDIPWSEVVKDRKTYVGTCLKKDLMVRQIATDSITGETVYICGEKKGESSYVGGTFTVFDRRSDKTRPIELYDKIYVYGQITGIFMTYSSYNPEFEVKYVQFNGKFGQ